MTRWRYFGARVALSAAATLLAVGLAEIPAALGLVDYRTIVPLPEGYWYTVRPWAHPSFVLDRELVQIRRPNLRLRGEQYGDLVYLLDLEDREPYPVDVRYDRNGFRNDADLDRAQVAVVGDSYVENAIVDEPITAHLRRRLGVTVANLGQPHYGPQQELAVLRRYGVRLAPQIVVWVLFEGNDLSDAASYERLNRDWDAAGPRPASIAERLLVTNAAIALRGWAVGDRGTKLFDAAQRSCTLRGTQGAESDRMYFFWGGDGLSEEERQGLDLTLSALRMADRLAAFHGARLLVAFVPSKYRVYRRACEFAPGTEVGRWTASDLPVRLADWSAAHDVAYVDVTPALEVAASRGELVYFPDDTHWNANGVNIGAAVVAEHIETRGWLNGHGGEEARQRAR